MISDSAHNIKDVAVVILNYNGRKWLEKFLHIVIQHSMPYQVIVVDNASTDDSVAYLQSIDGIELITYDHNGGYAGGYAQALEDLSPKGFDYYILLNSDIEVPQGWITPVIDFMEQNQVAICQPKIKSYHDRSSFEYAGAAGGYLDKFGYPFCRGRIFDTLEKDTGQYDTAQPIFWASGACIFLNKAVAHQVPLDRRFFAHMEEIDLCWRAQRQGFKIYFCPDAEVYHVGGGTLNQGSTFKTYLNFRNNILMLYKNLPKTKLLSVIFVRLVLDGLAGLKYLFDLKPKHTFAIIRAHYAFYRMIGKGKWRQREEKEVSHDDLSGFFRKSIIKYYYIYKKKIFSSLEFPNSRPST